MGLMLSAKCPCGIEAQLFVGSGMVEAPPRVPAWCKACEELVTATRARRQRCKKCRGPLKLLEPFGSAALGVDYPEAPIACPRCGKPSLRFEPVGRWD